LKTKDGWTALMFAAQKKDTKMVSKLLEHEAGPNL